MDESRLIDQALSGDRRAYGTLAEACRPALFAVVFRMTGDREAAMDATQEALLRGWRSLGQFQRGSKLSTWLVRIGVNVVLNERRRKSRRPQEVSSDLLGPASDDRGPRPERDAAAHELQTAFRAALAELPDALRAAVVLRELEGQSYKEIAGALEIPVGTVMSRLHNARRLLRKRLLAFMPDGGGR